MKKHLFKSTLIFLAIINFSCSKNSNNIPKNPETSNSDKVWVTGDGQVNGNVDFGEIVPGTNKIVSLTIKNVGNTTISASPVVSGDFILVYQSNCVNLAPEHSCLTKIAFSSIGKPEGTYSGQITMGDYSGSLSAIVLPQTTSADLSVKVNSQEVTDNIDFGSLNYRESVIKTLNVKNNGDAAENITTNLPTNFTTVYDNCSGNTLHPKTNCFLKLYLSGQGKDGSVNDSITIGSKTLSVSAQVEGRGESVENNSHLISLVDAQSLETNGVMDLGTVNTSSKLLKTVFLKNIGSDQTPVLSVSTSSGTFLYNQCSSALNPNQSCKIQISLPTDPKGMKQSLLTVSGYQSDKSFSLEYVVRSPGDTIDCSDGLDNVATAEITWNGSSYSSCQVLTCVAEYHVNSNACVPDNLNLTITQPDSGRGTISGPSTVLYGGSATFTYTGNVAYVLDTWGNSCSSITGNSCTIDNITEDTVISVIPKCSSTYTLSAGECLRTINLTATSSANYNIFSQASSPADKVVVNLNINSGIVLSSSSTASPALTTGTGWVSGSVININNNGRILGMGGAGGIGGASYSGNTAGYPGGPAIVLQYPVTITNTGDIFGGGGGGGGSTWWDLVNTLSCGGGGGGGQGAANSSGGSLGSCFSGAPYPQGTAGNAGTISSPGTGGNGKTYCTGYGCSVNEKGGDGGSWGTAGNNGGNSYNSASPGSYRAGMPGGAAGNSITTNGNAVNWISGSDSTHLKGPVQ